MFILFFLLSNLLKYETVTKISSTTNMQNLDLANIGDLKVNAISFNLTVTNSGCDFSELNQTATCKI